jgi:hypothetical protein
MVLELQSDKRSTTQGRHSMGAKMSIYEAIGMAWVIFTSAIASVEILYLAFVGLKTKLNGHHYESRDNEVPVEVKEMFKIAR